jgi:hypothetical protein
MNHCIHTMSAAQVGQTPSARSTAPDPESFSRILGSAAESRSQIALSTASTADSQALRRTS